jgi:hypothetical protein
MDVAKLLEPIATTRRRVADRIHESSARFPYLRRKRRVVALWLLTAHGAQIAAFALFLFLQFGFPRARDATLDRAFPESVSGKLVGLFGSESRADKRRHVAGRAVTILAWVGGGSIALLMLWVRIPAAMSRTEAIARQREAEADELLGSTPSRSVMLYRSALALAWDADYEQALEQKLHRIDEQLSRAPDEGDERTWDKDTGDKVGGRYKITEELGRGANGVVYRADDEVLDREVALKELPVRLSNDDFAAARFRQEARVLAKMNHPNIVQVYDFIEHHKRMWMAIELVEGGNLALYLGRRGVLAAPEACRLGGASSIAISSRSTCFLPTKKLPRWRTSVLPNLPKAASTPSRGRLWGRRTT